MFPNKHYEKYIKNVKNAFFYPNNKKAFVNRNVVNKTLPSILTCVCCRQWRRQIIQEAQLLLGDRATRKHAKDS